MLCDKAYKKALHLKIKVSDCKTMANNFALKAMS